MSARTRFSSSVPRRAVASAGQGAQPKQATQPKQVEQAQQVAQAAKVLQALAIAYAERLSCLHGNASAAELADSARRIESLEQQCRSAAGVSNGPARAVDVRESTAEGHHEVFRLDSAVYLG